MNQLNEQPVDLLTAKQVCKTLSMSKTSLWRLVKSGRFPKPLKFGPRATRWRLDEVNAAIAQLSAEREAS